MAEGGAVDTRGYGTVFSGRARGGKGGVIYGIVRSGAETRREKWQGKLFVFGAPVEGVFFLTVGEEVFDVAHGVFVVAGEIVGKVVEFFGPGEALVGIARGVGEAENRGMPFAAGFGLEGAFVEDHGLVEDKVFTDVAAFAFVGNAVGFEDGI